MTHPIPSNSSPLSHVSSVPPKMLRSQPDKTAVAAPSTPPAAAQEKLSLQALPAGNVPPAKSLNFPWSTPDNWGSRSQIEGTFRELLDVQGNRDGLWNDESQASGKVGSFADRNPLLLKVGAKLAGIGDTDEQVEQLQAFRATREKQWGAPTTQLPLDQLKDGELFATQKALTLTRMERHPATVSEGFVKAAGKVNGVEIAPRDVFWQRFQPTGTPNGKMVVMSPGFQQTGRNFHEQVQLLSAQGYDVMTLDHQWSGQTKGGKDGGLDRGYGVARDVAAVAAFAAQELAKDYGDHPDKELLLLGTSMGGGPGVLGALTLNDQGLIDLEGPAMPKGLHAVLQGPFLETTPSVLNKGLGLGSKIPLANQIPTPAMGLPVLTSDDQAAQKMAQGAVMEDVRARLQAMGSASADVQEILKLIAAGKGPQGHIHIIHSQGDPLANPARSEWLSQHLPHAQLEMLPGDDHVLEQGVATQTQAVIALQNLP
jgi:alpha-beta hydrolase superfamily lysophospholipase